MQTSKEQLGRLSCLVAHVQSHGLKTRLDSAHQCCCTIDCLDEQVEHYQLVGLWHLRMVNVTLVEALCSALMK